MELATFVLGVGALIATLAALVQKKTGLRIGLGAVAGVGGLIAVWMAFNGGVPAITPGINAKPSPGQSTEVTLGIPPSPTAPSPGDTGGNGGGSTGGGSTGGGGGGSTGGGSTGGGNTGGGSTGGGTGGGVVVDTPPPPPPTTPPPPPCSQKIDLTSPGWNANVTGHIGVTISGTACGLAAGESGWIFDFDPEDQLYYEADHYPIAGNGQWSYFDSPIGDEGDNGKTYILQVVLASASCGQFLESLPENSEGDVVLSRSDFPSGCTFIDNVQIQVTW